MKSTVRSTHDYTGQLIDAALRAGAAHADALSVSDTGDAINVRNGTVESVEREDARGVGLRAFVETASGMAFATASTSDVSPQGLQKLAEQVLAMARISEADPDAVPPVGANHPTEQQLADWRLRHPESDAGWSLEEARDAALACEEVALSCSTAISNSEGAAASFGISHVVYASSDGFSAAYSKASASLSISVIAGHGDGMQRDYAWHRALHVSGLRTPDLIGREAAERAWRRLDPGSMESGAATVVFEPRIATSLLGHLIGAINGRAILQQRSFLTDCLHQPLFPAGVCIDDNPDHPDGLGNRLFDGEGTRTASHRLVSDGVLQHFLTDRYTARRLGMPETGSAVRGLTGDIGIGSANLIWQPGSLSQTDIIRQIRHGLLVTELIGFGVNSVTGDYSRGASGFLIENGMIVRPVQGITIAGNLKEMFAQISHVGSDLTWFGSSAVPSIAIEGMTIAGA
ncbi:TldD/PmbA family protein [Mariprofundus erugo]|uniref:TldD/PmbA family protein n=1 Tax=Mariprofundus erugo TaxID=2528639 RepID=A0A5R9GT32_9PROT|nr:TldD/PmbA family protein [Mariprofundus erugo]TLS67603.1 TldD/PmbA family protein [Mariprofundus erugo]